MTTGQASGNSMRSSRWVRVSPMPLAASTIAGSTPLRPATVLRTTGISPYIVSATMTGREPSPSGAINKMNSANDGIVSMAPVTARTKSRARGR